MTEHRTVEQIKRDAEATAVFIRVVLLGGFGFLVGLTIGFLIK